MNDLTLPDTPNGVPDFDDAAFAATVNLETVRRRLGWSQDRMAEVMGCNRSQVSRWESGRWKPPLLARRLYWSLHHTAPAKDRTPAEGGAA